MKKRYCHLFAKRLNLRAVAINLNQANAQHNLGRQRTSLKYVVTHYRTDTSHCPTSTCALLVVRHKIGRRSNVRLHKFYFFRCNTKFPCKTFNTCRDDKQQEKKQMRARRKNKASVVSRSWPTFLERNTVWLGQIDQLPFEPKSKKRRKTAEREMKLHDMKINYI